MINLAAKLLREITPLTQSDCFTIFSRTKREFDFPLHYHDEYELNFIQNAAGAKRVVGDHVEEIGSIELVLVGPNLQHGWLTNKCKGKLIKEITIQFHRDLFDEKFLQRNQMSFIRTLLQRSTRGVLFSRAATVKIMGRLVQLPQKHGFDSVLELMSVIHDLSTSANIRTLSDVSFNIETPTYNSRRIEKIMTFLNNNFSENITLADVAKIAGMAEVSLSRFFKFRTGKTFIDTLNEVRLGHASRMLIDTTNSINEVAYKCGFNNMSNFNRIFKKKKDSTPKEFRQTYTTNGIRKFV
jgi:AraC-like DNA-binding protein